MEFTPFSIECITCGTRLKVTDPSLVGQITFCLKCQSMVEVTQPETPDTGETEEAEPPRATVDPAQGFDNLELDEPPVPAAEPPVDVAEPPVAESGASASESSAGDSAPAAEKKKKQAAAVAAVAPVVKELPTPASTVDATRSAAEPPPAPAETGSFHMPATPEPTWKKHLTLGLSALTGIALAIAAWVFWSAGQTGDSSKPVAHAVSTSPSVLPYVPSVDALASDEAVAEPPTEPVDDTRVAEPSPPRDPLPALPEAADPTPQEVAQPEPPQEADPAETTDDPQMVADGPSTSDPLASSPFDFDFENPLPNDFVRSESQPEPPADAEEVGPQQPPQPPAPSAEIERLLAMSVPAVQIPSSRPVPLTRFVDFVASMLGRRVLLDPLALEAAGIDATAPVVVDSRSASLGELIARTVARYGLGYQAFGDTILITTAAAEQLQTRKVRFRIGDLATTTGEMTQFADMVREIINPTSWSTVGGSANLTVDGDSLLVDHRTAERYQLLVLCEKLRVARGLEPKSRYDASRFELAARSVQAEDVLKRTVTLEPGESLPLEVVLKQLAYQADVKLELDLLALIAENRSASMDADLSVVDQPLGEALDRCLQPLGLVHYPLDADRFVVTTPYAMAHTMLWEVFAVPANLGTVSDVQQWTDQLVAEVEPAAWDAVGGPGRIVFDRGSRHVIVRQNPEVLAELAERLGT